MVGDALIHNAVYSDARRLANYNGYDLSYLVVRYLMETNSQRDFYFIMKDKDLIKSIGNNVLESAMKYYKNKYFNTLNIK